jgi:hypothetical protein
MATKLAHSDLYSLEEYSRMRDDFRARVLEHKQHRHVAIGSHVSLHFEDSLTMQYQIQEMLRVEKIFEAAGIQDELDAYNPLIPDGSNWKATMLIEYQEVDERQVALQKLLGIEDQIWVQVAGGTRAYAIADEDMDRATEDKTSAVHFLRFELTAEDVSHLRGGKGLSIGISHAEYDVAVAEIAETIRESLLADLD